jgi:hypothetical protein
MLGPGLHRLQTFIHDVDGDIELRTGARARLQ